ncbi:MAG: dTMP kinase [Bacillota bacterium]
MGKGFFIAFEGIDGAGKTTQVNLLSEALVEKGCRVLLTRDPGGTALGESLRNVLLYGKLPIDPLAESLLYAAARAQLVAERILPALREGAVVISDRFADSTHAYQGSGRGVSGEFLERINSCACMGLVPDITILLDMDPAAAPARLQRPADRMEREGQGFLRRVREGYLARAKQAPHRYLVLDASRPAGELFARVSEAVENLILSNLS